MDFFYYSINRAAVNLFGKLLVLRVDTNLVDGTVGRIGKNRLQSIFDCDILYFLFIECTGAFTFLNEYRIWPRLYFFFGSIRYSIFDSFCPDYFISL